MVPPPAAGQQGAERRRPGKNLLLFARRGCYPGLRAARATACPAPSLGCRTCRRGVNRPRRR